uniref:C2H2-type domain-containing protein n=1 Tax=Anopheles christyi TaxID=43041 RepID=A0A182JZJ5_9DIPT
MEAKQEHSAASPVKEMVQCTIEGCRQSFPSEGHCSVHTKKHDLSLNLQMPQKGPAGGLFADQTPTPTRLIGKCEEVGLFEDLQKVNPFDETFRRAVESGASSVSSLGDDQSPLIPSLSVPCCRAVEGETLHTPHIFPSGIDRSSLLDGIFAGGSDIPTATKQPRSKAKVSGPSTRGKQQQEQASATTTNNTAITAKARKEQKGHKKAPLKRKAPAPTVDILPKPAVTQQPLPHESIPLIIIPSDPSDTKQPAEGNVLVKEKLKEHLAKVRETGVTLKESSPGKKRLKRVEEKPETPSKLVKPIDLTQSPDDQANLKHERWKEAAKRYRMRIKKSQDQQLQRNIELEEENIRLRTQLTEMRNAHRNCNVTRSQNIAKLAQGYRLVDLF